MRRMEPIRLHDQLKGLEGQWVAIKNGNLVAAKETPDLLRLHLHDHDITDASMFRVPDLEDAEVVGFG